MWGYQGDIKCSPYKQPEGLRPSLNSPLNANLSLRRGGQEARPVSLGHSCFENYPWQDGQFLLLFLGSFFQKFLTARLVTASLYPHSNQLNKGLRYVLQVINWFYEEMETVANIKSLGRLGWWAISWEEAIPRHCQTVAGLRLPLLSLNPSPFAINNQKMAQISTVFVLKILSS